MNDRFSGQLRQHLIDTANERPADGQLATVLDRVADTGQRRGILARLGGSSWRAGPIPSPMLRHGLVLALVAAGIAATFYAVGGETAPIPTTTVPPTEPPPSASTVFEGTWTAIDPGDDSRLTLVVGEGLNPTVVFRDDRSTGGVCAADEVKVFTADGFGEITGNRLVATFPDGGGCGSQTVDIAPRYDYVPRADQLVDQDGVIWSRVPGGGTPTGPPPSVAPSDAPLPTAFPSIPPATFPAFEVDPSYTCTLSAGTYGGWFGDVRVDATTPTTWHGLDDVFHAEEEGCGEGGAVRLEITVASEVYSDICQWLGTGVEAGTPDAGTAAFSEAEPFDVVGPAETELGGYPALRYGLTLPADFDASTCSNGRYQYWRDPAREEGFGPTGFEPGSLDVYFVEVGDVTLGVYAFKGDDWATPVMEAELDAVVDSLVFDVQER